MDPIEDEWELSGSEDPEEPEEPEEPDVDLDEDLDEDQDEDPADLHGRDLDEDLDEDPLPRKKQKKTNFEDDKFRLNHVNFLARKLQGLVKAGKEFAMASKIEGEVVQYVERCMIGMNVSHRTTRLRSRLNTSNNNSWSNIYKQQTYKQRLLVMIKAIEKHDLIGRLRSRELWDTTNLTAEEIDPTCWRVQLEREHRERDELMQLSNAKWTGARQDGVFTCRRCKSKKTTYTELQTRSADEPMTIFITCLDCSHRMKM